MTVIIFLIILAVLVLVHEFGHFIAAKKSGIRVDEFGIGFPPTIFSWKPKKSETRYFLNIIPFGGYVKIFGETPDDESMSGPDSKRSFVNKPKYIQVWVLAAGVIFNIIFAWALITIGLMTGLPSVINDSNREYARDSGLTITEVLPESPAFDAGLKPGDRIININSRANHSIPITADEVSNIIANSNSQELILTYVRGDTEIAHEASLIAEEGIIEEAPAIGIAMDEIGLISFPLIKAVIEGTKMTGNLLIAITIGLTDFIIDIFSGGADFSQVSGPVGIVGLVGDASDLGLIYLLSFTALISLHLAVLNLIPFPALDGGRILFVIIEAIIRRPINSRVQNWANGIGFALLILLMIIVTYKDIIKLF
jgi:regulator of sigma E protease